MEEWERTDSLSFTVVVPLAFGQGGDAHAPVVLQFRDAFAESKFVCAHGQRRLNERVERRTEEAINKDFVVLGGLDPRKDLAAENEISLLLRLLPLVLQQL